MAMAVLYKMGEIFGAEDMIPVSCAHIDGCSYAAVWDGGLEFAEKLAESGGRVAVPTTLNITSRDINDWKSFRIPAEFSEKCRRMEQAYYDMGCIPTWTCAPYQYSGVIPSFGSQVAWAESNAVNYVNSVIGARSERYGDLVDICCALAGRVPRLGLHITENRAATMVFDFHSVSPSLLREPAHFAAVGYYIGGMTGQAVPALDRMPVPVSQEDLKALSAAAASSGPVGLFHVVGTTPEAPTLQAATQGKNPRQVVPVTDADIEQAYAQLTNTNETGDVVEIDLAVTGCPHLSYSQAVKVAELLAGRKVRQGVAFWIQTNDSVYNLLERTGHLSRLRESGVQIMRDGCLMNQPTGPQWGFRNIVTNSGKMAHYAPGNVGANVYFRELGQLVESAVTGRLSNK